jgi:DnaJ-class molecular chaperone
VIEEKYWETAHELHRDLHEQPTKKLQKKLAGLNEAYEVLGSPMKRSAYDRKRDDAIEHRTALEGRPSILQSFVRVLGMPFRPD